LRKELVAQLLRALIDPEGRATGIALGLAGASGSGKSSVLNMVAERTEQHHPAAVVIRFNPCLADPRNGLVHAFFAEARAALDASAKSPSCQQPDKLKSLGQTLFRYAKRVALPTTLLCDGGPPRLVSRCGRAPSATPAQMRAELIRNSTRAGSTSSY
jgi:hypothetical protein